MRTANLVVQVLERLNKEFWVQKMKDRCECCGWDGSDEVEIFGNVEEGF